MHVRQGIRGLGLGGGGVGVFGGGGGCLRGSWAGVGGAGVGRRQGRGGRKTLDGRCWWWCWWWRNWGCVVAVWVVVGCTWSMRVWMCDVTRALSVGGSGPPWVVVEDTLRRCSGLYIIMGVLWESGSEPRRSRGGWGGSSPNAVLGMPSGEGAELRRGYVR